MQQERRVARSEHGGVARPERAWRARELSERPASPPRKYRAWRFHAHRIHALGVPPSLASPIWGWHALNMDVKGVAMPLTVEHGNRPVHLDRHWPHPRVPAGTGVFPIDGPFDQFAPHWVSVDIVDHLLHRR